jgi:CRP-like cAMP-binding protein
MSNIWFFEKVNLFDIFCPRKFGDFSTTDPFKYYRKGEFIYFSDDTANSIYLIAGGKVKILNYSPDGDEVIKGVLSKGEIFGELAIFGEEKRSDFAQAMNDKTSICQLNIDQMQDLMQEDQSFALKINKLVGLRIRKLERRLDSLVFKDVRARIIEFIRELVTEKGEKSGGGYFVKHDLTHKDISQLIGTTRQTVTTLMNDLKKEGIIDFTRKTIRVNNMDLLLPAERE